MGVHKPFLFFLTSAVFFACGLATLAQSPQSLSPPNSPAESDAICADDCPVLPSPLPAAVGPQQAAATCTAIPKKPIDGDKLTHLRQAAQHLNAAGMAELAKQVNKEALLEEKLQQLRKLQQEVEMLQGPTPSQQVVTIDLKIMELQVSKMRELGFDFQIAKGTGIEQFTEHSLVEFDGLLSALRQNDLVKILAEPKLVTVSGHPASFRSGGEFPILVPQQPDEVAIEYQEFGTSLDCVAIVQDNGAIRLEVRASITEIDTTRSVSIQGTSVPALRTRMVDTAVEMQPGKTLILSGLNRRQTSDGIEGSEAVETALLVSFKVDLCEPIARTDDSAQPPLR
jgi:Flp pilus assembly secretin CpaC